MGAAPSIAPVQFSWTASGSLRSAIALRLPPAPNACTSRARRSCLGSSTATSIFLTGLPDATVQDRDPPALRSLRIVEHARRTLAAGFTKVRDVGGRDHL